MIILPLRTGILRPGDDLAATLMRDSDIIDGDVIVVSSKAVATTEGAAADLLSLTPTEAANQWAVRCGMSPAFCQAVLNECMRMNGSVIGASPHALLTELRPRGFSGRLLVPNAGLDQSNVAADMAIGWPVDPVMSARSLRSALMQATGKRTAIIISDSCCWPGRLGVTAFALAACGIDPTGSDIGKPDLFGKKLRVTHEAVADQLATAANMVMGNAAQATPGAIVRGHGYDPTDFCGWVDGIDASEDIFAPIFRA